MNKKTQFNDIVDIFLTACAGAEGLTEEKEIAEYVKNRKEDIQTLMNKKDVK